jgi:hypothetical protein
MKHDDDTESTKDTPAPVAASTITEFLVRESISDEENRLTADHHLDGRSHPDEKSDGNRSTDPKTD